MEKKREIKAEGWLIENGEGHGDKVSMESKSYCNEITLAIQLVNIQSDGRIRCLCVCGGGDLF